MPAAGTHRRERRPCRSVSALRADGGPAPSRGRPPSMWPVTVDAPCPYRSAHRRLALPCLGRYLARVRADEIAAIAATIGVGTSVINVVMAAFLIKRQDHLENGAANDFQTSWRNLSMRLSRTRLRCSRRTGPPQPSRRGRRSPRARHRTWWLRRPCRHDVAVAEGLPSGTPPGPVSGDRTGSRSGPCWRRRVVRGKRTRAGGRLP